MSLTIWKAALVVAIGKCNHSAAILEYPPDGPIWQADCGACIRRSTEMRADLSRSLQHVFTMCNVHKIRMQQAFRRCHVSAQAVSGCYKEASEVIAVAHQAKSIHTCWLGAASSEHLALKPSFC